MTVGLLFTYIYICLLFGDWYMNEGKKKRVEHPQYVNLTKNGIWVVNLLSVFSEWCKSVNVFCYLLVQKKLIMVGSRETLSKVLLMKLLMEKVDEQSGILNVSKKDINFKRELKRCSQVRWLYFGSFVDVLLKPEFLSSFGNVLM